MGLDDLEKLKEKKKIGDYFDEPEYCPKCRPSEKKKYGRRNHLIKHLTSNKHGLSPDIARKIAYGEQITVVADEKVQDDEVKINK